MKDGYIKVAAATPKVKVADTVYNGQLIKALMKECTDNGAKVVVFPELCITGYTCQARRTNADRISWLYLVLQCPFHYS